jgi:hypothetical protein
LARSQTVKSLGAFHLPLELGDIPEIVQGKGIARIKEISFIKEFLGFVVVILSDGLHAFAVQPLDGRQVAALGNVDSKIPG